MNVPALGIHVQWNTMGTTGWEVTQVHAGGRASRGRTPLRVGDIIERVNTPLRVHHLPLARGETLPPIQNRIPRTSGDLDAACRHRPLSLEIRRPVLHFTGPSLQRMCANIP